MAATELSPAVCAGMSSFDPVGFPRGWRSSQLDFSHSVADMYSRSEACLGGGCGGKSACSCEFGVQFELEALRCSNGSSGRCPVALGGKIGSGGLALLNAVLDSFGDLTRCRETFFRIGLEMVEQGSSWVWLVLDVRTSRLSWVPTRDSDLPPGVGSGVQLLVGCDLWEHAFLDFESPKAYLEAFWAALDWTVLEQRAALLRSRFMKSSL